MPSQDVTVEALGLAVAAGVPVLLWGAPGTGKTSAIAALAEAASLPFETVIAAIREPSDFSGLPVVVDGVVRFAPPRWAERLADAGRGLLFLDEISTAPPAVQAALLRVVLERVVGDLALPSDVVVVAAANPPEQAADGWDLSAPLANRFCHLDWDVDPMGFAEGIAGGWKPARVPTLPEGWETTWPRARGMVSAFVTVRPSSPSTCPSTAPAPGGRGPAPAPGRWPLGSGRRPMWPAPASRRRAALISGAIGDAAGLELLTWHHEMDLPDPEAVLADPDGVELPDRGDRAYAVLCVGGRGRRRRSDDRAVERRLAGAGPGRRTGAGRRRRRRPRAGPVSAGRGRGPARGQAVPPLAPGRRPLFLIVEPGPRRTSTATVGGGSLVGRQPLPLPRVGPVRHRGDRT